MRLFQSRKDIEYNLGSSCIKQNVFIKCLKLQQSNNWPIFCWVLKTVKGPITKIEGRIKLLLTKTFFRKSLRYLKNNFIYHKTWPWRALYVITRTLNWILNFMESQWRGIQIIVTWDLLEDLIKSSAAAFWTTCYLFTSRHHWDYGLK